MMLPPCRSRKQMLTQQQRNNRRRRANPRQLAYLRKKFSEDPKPDQAARESIGRAIDMTPRSVQIWFQNNRAKAKEQERKYSVHRKLYSMTTTVRSGNISCIRTNPHAHPFLASEHVSSSFPTSTPVRFFTPQPIGSYVPESPGSSWVEGELSDSAFDFEFSDSQTDTRGSGRSLRGYNKLHALSMTSVERPGLYAPFKNFSQTSYEIQDNEEQYALQIQSEQEDFLSDIDFGSPISPLESVKEDDNTSLSVSSALYEYDPAECEVSPKSDRETSERTVDIVDLSLQGLTFPTEDSPENVSPSSLEASELELAALMDSLDVCSSQTQLSQALDFVRLPCSLSRIGEWICENDGIGSETLVVRYSVSKQILQMIIRDTERHRLCVVERDVLHFPKSYTLRKLSYGYAHIEIAVFGVPRLLTLDFDGNAVQSADPTDGEIYLAQDFNFFGNFEDIIAALQTLENSNVCDDWLSGRTDLSQQSISFMTDLFLPNDGATS